MWTNRVLMCGIDILLCLWAVYLFFFYFDIFFVRKRKRYLSVIGMTLFVVWQFGITTIISFPAYINIAVTIMFTFLAVMHTATFRGHQGRVLRPDRAIISGQF